MTTKPPLIIFILLLLFLVVPGSLLVHAANPAWVSKAPMHEARSGLGVAVVNGKIYAIGGAGKGGFSATNEEYDPATDAWTFKAPMPTPRSVFGIAVYENKIYCIGGYTNSSGTATAVNQVYNPATDTWADKTSMPTARLNLHANVVNGKIYLIGGIPIPDTGRTLNEVYDPATDKWIAKAPIPTGVDSYGSAVVGIRIFVMKSGLTQIYDAESDGWSTGVEPPVNSLIASAVTTTAINSPDRIYLFGANAQDPYGMLSNQGFTTQSYDITSGNWTVGTSMPTGRFDPGVAAIKDKIYLIGGYNYGTPTEAGFTLNRSIIFSTTNEQYTPALDDTAYVDKTQTSPQPSYSPISPPTPQSIIKDPENTPHPAASLPAKETQLDAVHFPTVPVAVISIIVIAVAAGLLIYFKKRKLRLDE